ncbi:hypothetical protein Asp14428_09760 [Actinoplanes sp. NBRC 14428]|nr:hypothetical protein Asp14428_09760 [Actinoplanes sp. NBRC 14428]
MPIWGHLLLGALTLGIYFLFLPLIILFDAVARAWAKVVEWVVSAIFSAVYRTLRAPFRFLWRHVKRWVNQPSNRT